MGGLEKGGKDEASTKPGDRRRNVLKARRPQPVRGEEKTGEVEGAELTMGEDERGQEGEVAEPADEELLAGGGQGGRTIPIELQQLVEAETESAPREGEPEQVAREYEGEDQGACETKPEHEAGLARIAQQIAI